MFYQRKHSDERANEIRVFSIEHTAGVSSKFDENSDHAKLCLTYYLIKRRSSSCALKEYHFFPLFLGNCFDNIISDVSYTATSTDPGHSPSDAVLDNDGGWCTSQNPPNEFLEVEFGHLYDVCGIVLQGFKNESVDSFTTKYMLSFSKVRPAWSYLQDISHSPEVNETLIK